MSELPPTITSDQFMCARCGGQHARLEFKRLGRVMQSPDGDYQYWAPCPLTGEPLLLRRREGRV